MGPGGLKFTQGGEGCFETRGTIGGGRVGANQDLRRCSATACKAWQCRSLQGSSKHILSCNYNLIAQSNADIAKTQNDKMSSRRVS